MTSETPSYLARKNHFQCFDYGKVLQSSAERSEEVDPEIGPYGQTSLGTKKMSEFRRLVNEFESLFSESLSGFTELRSQFDADRTSTTAKQIYQEELIQNSTTTFWYITTGLKLASETFWNTLDFPASNKAASESLKIKWLLHAKWAYLSSPKLVKAKELLQRITLYAQEAEKELKSTEARRNFDPRNISEISVPFFKQASVKNPIHVSSQFPRFSEKYHIYLARLQSQISRVNKSLAEAMLVRLELASESDDLESDDVLYDCAKRIQGLVDPETFRSISLPKDAPRKTLNKEAYQIFPLHILEFGDEVSVARLQKLKWIGAVDGIPCQLTKSPDSQLCITSHHGSYPVNMTPHVHPYDLALFNIAIHNIQHWNQLFPRGSSIEFKSIDFSTLCPLFKSVFLFIKVAAEQLKAPSTQSKEAWVHLLTAKTGQVLDFSHRFLTFMRTKENQLNLNINADYTLLVGEIRDFCDFMAKNTKDLKKNKEILKIFEDTRQPLVDEFFNLLRAKKIAENRGALENCLGLLRSCVSAEHRKHVQVIQKLLFNEDLSSISLQDIRQALESPAFNVPQEKIYAEMKLLIETAYHLRNKKLSPPLVRLVQAFDQEFGPSLVKMITQDNEARVKAAIALLENVDFQLTPYRDILDALTVLSSFRGIASHGRILHNFIDRFLKHYKGQDFLALEMVLLVNSEDQVRAFARARLETILSTDPALLIADETRHGFERIFQCYPSLRDEMSVYVIPLIDGFIANIPRQIEDCMAPPNPPFKVNGLLPGEALEIVNFFLPSKKASYCESIDRPFYSYLEALINHGGSAQKIESFSELLIYNFLSFPESEHFRKKIRESLEILVSRPWTPIGHELCRQFDLVEPRTILAKSRIQLLQKILEDRDGSFNNTLKTLVSSGKIRDLKNITPGLVGICEFYGSENRDRVLNLIELFLQSPIYHPITFELLQTHLSHEAISGEISSPKFDVLSAQFRHISQFQAKTDATLRALRESNFGLFSEFRDDLHIEILRQDQPYQAILSIYIGFLQELEDQLRISLRDQLEDKSKYIIQVFKKSYTSSEEETFRQWLDSEKVPKELFESYCAVLERLDSIAQDANEIKSVFRIIFNIKRLYVSDKDWILEFPQSRIDACLNTLSLGERRQLASALSLLNAEKYHIISKEALSAFRRLLLQETDNPQKEVDLLKDASDVAEANAKFRKLGAGAQKDAFQVELQDKYRKRPQFLATFMQVLMQDSAAELRKREFWENNICALFPAIFESDASQSEQRLVHSFVWGIRQITLEVFSQLFGEDGHLLGAKDYNRHVVTPVHLPHLRAPVGHIKFFPDSPGIQYAARTLSVLLENPLPCHELLKFPSSTAGQQRAYPVSLSEHSSGQPLLGFWNRNEKVKLHPGFFSREFLRVLLTRDVDGLPSNYFVEEVKDSGTYRLVCIEDEAAFGDVVIKKGNKLELMHVSAVYCFDDMNQPLDPEVRKFILSLDIFSFVNSFITDVSNYNNRLSQTDKGSCFFDQEECQFWATHKEHPVVIPFPFLDEKLVRETIRVLSKLQELVHANSQITHIQVLEEIYPELIPYYVPALREAISPKERLDQVLKRGRGDDCLLVHGSYISTRNDTQVYLSHFGHVPSTGELTRKETTAGIVAKDTLLSIGKLLEILKPARAA